MGLLEVAAGVLFDPVNTFRRLAPAPPVGKAVILATLVNAATGLMGYFTFRALPPGGAQDPVPGLLAAMLPALSITGFFLWYAKWFVHGGFLHFVAQLLGGRGLPLGTLTVYALAALPDVFIVPVQGVLVLLELPEVTASVVQGIAGLALFIWAVVLLVLGLRETHGFSSGHAVATVLGPVAGMVLVAVVFFVLTVASVAPLLPDVSAPLRLHRSWP
ncbi:MAG: Yip1 family protein [Desulfotomaculales bacterium]